MCIYAKFKGDRFALQRMASDARRWCCDTAGMFHTVIKSAWMWEVKENYWDDAYASAYEIALRVL